MVSNPSARAEVVYQDEPQGERRLYLLGTCFLAGGGEPQVEFESNKVRALLAYLVVGRSQRHSRDALASLLWPDLSDVAARKNLAQALFNLRKVLGDPHAWTPHLLVDRQAVQLNPARPLWSDVGEFVALLEAVERHPHRALERCPTCAWRLERAVTLYRGEFLAGLTVKRSSTFDDWLALTRERLHQQAVQALEALVRHYALTGRLNVAQQYAERLVRLDPWREECYAQLMRLLAAQGQRSAALRVFKQCEQMLQEEFGADPSPATCTLAQRIRANDPTLQEPLPPPPLDLPPQLTTFVGREAELLEIGDLLAQPDCRLLTLVGPGGVGKTRLALQAGRMMRFGFADGVFFVPLASTEGEQALSLAVVNALKVIPRHAETPLEALIKALGHKEVLLILDNFDHLVESTAELVALLEHTQRVAALVTSRRVLGIAEERVYRVAGLSYPPAEREALAGEWDAVRLFVERARQKVPDFHCEGETCRHVAHICRLAEGLPLAIELAAASLRALPCGEVARRMAHDLDVLTVEWPDLPSRHRSIERAFEHSWRLLAPASQATFARLSVFRGGFTAEAAVRVAGARPQDLADLVDASFLVREADGRFHLHELLRQFAAQKLGDEKDEVARRHSTFFAEAAEARRPHLRDRRQLEALRWMAREFDNLRAAWTWAVEHEDPDRLAPLVEPLYHFLERQSRFEEGRVLFTRATEALTADAGKLFWRVQLRRATFLYRTGHYAEAEAWLNTCQETFHALQMYEEEVAAWQTLGNIAYLRGDYQAAEAHLARALEGGRRLEEGRAIGDALNTLGLVACMKGQYARARELLLESLEALEAIDAPWECALPLNNLGIVCYALGAYGQARKHYRQALRLWQEQGRTEFVASCHNNLGLVAEAQGKLEEARREYRQALDTLRYLHSPTADAAVLNNLGNVEAKLGNFEAAEACYRRSLALRQQLGERRGMLSVMNNLGSLAWLQGDHQTALARAHEVVRGALDAQLAPVALDGFCLLAEIRAAEGHLREAAVLLHLVVNHPATIHGTRDQATKKLAEIQPHLTAEERHQAEAQAASLTLEAAARLFLQADEPRP